MSRMPVVLLPALLLAYSALALAQQHDHSPYAGFKGREIKSLSQDDIGELRNGGGWRCRRS